MIIGKIQEDNFFNREFVENLIEETIKDILPNDLKKYLSDKNNRDTMYEQYGDHSFLNPTDQRLPVIHPKTGQYDCKLIYCARLSAKRDNNVELYEQATNLYNKCNCGKRVDIEIDGHEKSYDLLEFLDILGI